MTSRIACHWQRTHPSQDDENYLRPWQPTNTKIITVADNDIPGLDTALQTVKSGGRVVVRHYPVSENWGARGFTDKASAETMANAHASYLARLWGVARARYTVAPEQLLWTGLNEPNVWGTEPPDLIAAYYARFMKQMHAAGLFVMTLNFGVGWPGNDGVKDAPPIWSPYDPVRDQFKPGDVLGLHEYWPVAGPAYAWRWLAGRYTQCPWDTPIIIGECGLDDAVAPGVHTLTATTPEDYTAFMSRTRKILYHKEEGLVEASAMQHFGWRGLDENADIAAAKYLGQMMWYDAKVVEDNRILGTEYFTYDTPDWKTFDIRAKELMLPMLAYIASVGGTALPPIVAPAPTPTPTPVYLHPIRVLMADGRVQIMELEEYLRGVVPSEVYPSWPADALKAQAVASRSYAMVAIESPRHGPGADVCTTTHCQVYNPARLNANTDAAIKATENEYMAYQGKPVLAMFSANCGGKTMSNEDVTGGAPVAYLRSVLCYNPGPKNGHGIGMCQDGAHDMAVAGDDYYTILRHYYTNIEFVKDGHPVPTPTPTPTPVPIPVDPVVFDWNGKQYDLKWLADTYGVVVDRSLRRAGTKNWVLKCIYLVRGDGYYVTLRNVPNGEVGYVGRTWLDNMGVPQAPNGWGNHAVPIGITCPPEARGSVVIAKTASGGAQQIRYITGPGDVMHERDGTSILWVIDSRFGSDVLRRVGVIRGGPFTYNFEFELEETTVPAQPPTPGPLPSEVEQAYNTLNDALQTIEDMRKQLDALKFLVDNAHQWLWEVITGEPDGS